MKRDSPLQLILINAMAKKTTSPKVAKVASKLLKDKQSSKKVKQVSGSALSQREKRRGK